MNLLSLRYFVTAAQELNFTRAAKKLYITQQSLSAHIAKLEAAYQVPLFDRGIPMTLTDAGKVLYQSASEILEELEKCDRRLQDIKDFTLGNLSIGIPVTRGTVMLPALCSAFHQFFPKIHLEIMEGDTSSVVEQALFDGQIDLQIGYLPSDMTNIISVPLYMETYVLCASNTLLKEYFTPEQLADLKLAPQPLSAFARCPFIAQAESTMGGRVFNQLCEEEGFSPHIVVATKNVLTELELCSAGLGICTLPNTFIEQKASFGRRPVIDSRRELSFFALQSATGTAQLSVNRLRSKHLTLAGREFIKLAQSIYAR